MKLLWISGGLGALAVLVLAGLWIYGAFFLSVPGFRGRLSDHFDGRRFRNLVPLKREGGGFWRWMRERRRGPWPKVSGPPAFPPPPERERGPGFRVTFINHASVLIQTSGLNILTDPIWSERSSPVAWAGPKRVRPPGLALDRLPPLDAILVSHNHYDHMDLESLRILSARDHPLILTGLGNGAFLAAHGVRGAHDMDWWDQVPLGPQGPGEIEVDFVPAQHFSGRGLRDRMDALWGGFMVRAPQGRIYFAGDTARGPHFSQIRDRLGKPDLALLPIGAYLPEWFMKPVHIGPEDILPVAGELGSHSVMAIHFGTFPLGDDGRDEAPKRLADIVRKAPEGGPEVWIPQFGESRLFTTK